MGTTIIGNLKLISKQLKKLNYNLKLNLITDIKDAKKKFINMINVDLKQKKTYTKISNKSNYYIKKCFEISLKILNNNKTNCVLINGPVSKKTFLKKNYLGITEYLSHKTSSQNEAMLIYNDKLSVSPLTTHIPVKFVAKKITSEKIHNNVINLNKFYKTILKRMVKRTIATPQFCTNPYKKFMTTMKNSPIPKTKPRSRLYLK